MLALSAVSALCSLRYDSAAPRQWVACISLLAHHMQTSAVLCGICRVWPANVERALACVLFSYTCVADPECIIDDPSFGLEAHEDAFRHATRLHGWACLDRAQTSCGDRSCHARLVA